jgi:hypothetical protein
MLLDDIPIPIYTDRFQNFLWPKQAFIYIMKFIIILIEIIKVILFPATVEFFRFGGDSNGLKSLVCKRLI